MILVACKQCPPGYGVKTPCDGITDTVCEKCSPGTYNSHFTIDSPCLTCGNCEDGFYRRIPCLPKKNVQCDHCQNGKTGFGNEDFMIKCEPYLTPPPTTMIIPTTEDIISTTEILWDILITTPESSFTSVGNMDNLHSTPEVGDETTRTIHHHEGDEKGTDGDVGNQIFITTMKNEEPSQEVTEVNTDDNINKEKDDTETSLTTSKYKLI